MFSASIASASPLLPLPPRQKKSTAPHHTASRHIVSCHLLCPSHLVTRPYAISPTSHRTLFPSYLVTRPYAISLTSHHTHISSHIVPITSCPDHMTSRPHVHHTLFPSHFVTRSYAISRTSHHTFPSHLVTRPHDISSTSSSHIGTITSLSRSHDILSASHPIDVRIKTQTCCRSHSWGRSLCSLPWPVKLLCALPLSCLVFGHGPPLSDAACLCISHLVGPTVDC